MRIQRRSAKRQALGAIKKVKIMGVISIEFDTMADQVAARQRPRWIGAAGRFLWLPTHARNWINPPAQWPKFRDMRAYFHRAIPLLRVSNPPNRRHLSKVLGSSPYRTVSDAIGQSHVLKFGQRFALGSEPMGIRS